MVIRHESEGLEVESPSGRDIFCLKTFDTFTRTSVPMPKKNAVAHMQLAFQMLTLLKKYDYILPENLTQNVILYGHWTISR